MTQDKLIKISFAISGVSLLVAIGAIVFAVSGRGQVSPQDLKQVSIPEPKALTADNPAAKIPHAPGLHSVGGTVKSASDSKLVLTVGNDEQSITVGSATKLYRQGAQKDPTAYQKEMQAFQVVLKNALGATEIFIAPAPYEMTSASLSEFTPGTNALAMVGADGVAVQIVIMPDAQPAAR